MKRTSPTSVAPGAARKYIGWGDLPRWARDAFQRVTKRQRVTRISLNVGESFTLAPGFYDWSIIDYVAKLPDGSVRSVHGATYDALLAATPSARQAYLGGKGTLAPGMQVLRIENVGRDTPIVDFYVHPEDAQALESGERININRAEAVLLAASGYKSEYRKQYIAELLAKAYPGEPLTELVSKWNAATVSLQEKKLLAKNNALTTKGREVKEQYWRTKYSDLPA